MSADTQPSEDGIGASRHPGEDDAGADSRWGALCAFSDTYTCYSSAVASWAAGEREEWAAAIDPGLTLRILDAGEGLFGFVHFPSGLRAELGLVRVSCDGPPAEAVVGVLAELQRSGRVIVAGDGFRLPWHVAHGRRHVPHWYLLSGTPARPEVLDPFACRNELGVQQATRVEIVPEQLAQALPALPGGDPVLELRERLALGDDCRERERGACEWFVRGEVADARAPGGRRAPRACGCWRAPCASAPRTRAPTCRRTTSGRSPATARSSPGTRRTWRCARPTGRSQRGSQSKLSRSRSVGATWAR